MRTLEEIKGRCYIDEDGHWLWRGAIRKGVPFVYAPNLAQGGKMSTQVGYRAAYQCAKGVAVPPRHRVFSTCDAPACLNPEHIRCATDAAYGRYIRSKGTFKGRVRRILANRATTLSRTKVTPEIVSLILASTESDAKTGAAFGVSKYLVWRIRNGKHPVKPAGAGGLSTMVSALTRKTA
ncbi:MAG: hypothetical protein DI604_12900 [Delftia acidovorans]|nr:MAG: hypothetical protein DI604_12900 [Delftia acidovorans]